MARFATFELDTGEQVAVNADNVQYVRPYRASDNPTSRIHFTEVETLIVVGTVQQIVAKLESRT